MSVKVSSWVWHEASKEIAGNELVVLLALADVANDNGACSYFEVPEDATQAALARKARVHRATLVRCIDKLVERGVLVKGRGRQHDPNSYRIQMSQNATTEEIQMSQTEPQMSQTGDSDVANREITPLTVRINVTTDVTSDVEPSDPRSGFSDDVVALCDEVAEMVTSNGFKNVTVSRSWLQAADRLVRLDGFSVDQVRIIARWATSHEFWSLNIRSMPKLRDQFDRLRLERNRVLQQGKSRSTLDIGRQADALLREREVARERQAVTA